MASEDAGDWEPTWSWGCTEPDMLTLSLCLVRASFPAVLPPCHLAGPRDTDLGVGRRGQPQGWGCNFS